jgi:hypothetical protein
MNKNLNEIYKEKILGARNNRTIIIMIILILAGLGFFLAGLSSYFKKNFLIISDSSSLSFFPQGIIMMFYGSLALGIGFYLLLTIFWNIGSGYNEFSKEDQIVKIVRIGFPGKNNKIFLSYDFKNIKTIKFSIKNGLNPRSNLFLVLKDQREIPLYPAQTLLNPNEVEKKAIYLSNLLNIPLENILL